MKQYVVDAFTDRIFSGNPAAVCVLDQWLSEELMLAITKENNLSETAFLVKEGGSYHLRWFTPGGEIDLCGHATLASAYVIMNFYEEVDEVSFQTLSGELQVKKIEDMYEMKFPAYALDEVEVTDAMERAIGVRPMAAYMGRDLLCVIDKGVDITSLEPDQALVKALDGLLLHVTQQSNDYDCVTRTFAPKLAVKEDPVCGSGHCHVVPYWASMLEKDELVCYQASPRGGILYCRLKGDFIWMSGKCALYSTADLKIR